MYLVYNWRLTGVVLALRGHGRRQRRLASSVHVRLVEAVHSTNLLEVGADARQYLLKISHSSCSTYESLSGRYSLELEKRMK